MRVILMLIFVDKHTFPIGIIRIIDDIVFFFRDSDDVRRQLTTASTNAKIQFYTLYREKLSLSFNVNPQPLQNNIVLPTRCKIPK